MSSFFSRSSTKSAAASPSSSSSSLAKDASATATPLKPPTSDLYSAPPEGVTPKRKWEYSAEQLKMIEELRLYTKSLLIDSSDPYYPWESRYLADPGTHPRFMRAAKWKMDDAKRRIKGTVEWRREYQPELIQPGDVGVEAETGKIIVTGFDEDARPVLYLRPGRENTKPSPRQIRHMIYFLERAIDLMPPGQEQVCIIVDYKSATSGSMPSISTGRAVLNILQNHYVERMGRGLVVNMPWWMNAFFAGISPLMDPITRDKIRFNPTLTELVPGPHLDKEFGGEYNFEYDYKTYWPQLTKFCRLAEDGTRVDDEGKTFYPPAGNGIQAAVDGLLPRAGAVHTGEVTKDPAESVQPNGLRSPPSFKDLGDAVLTPSTPATPVTPAAAGVAAVAGGTGGTGLEDGVERLKVADGDKDKAKGDDEDENDGDEFHDAVPEPPAVQTKPGEPVGEVVFDHPPTEAEKAEVKA